MARRMSGDSWLSGPLAISSWRMVPDRATWLWTSGQRGHLVQEGRGEFVGQGHLHVVGAHPLRQLRGARRRCAR